MKRRKFLKVSVAGGTLACVGAALLAARSKNGVPPQGLNNLFRDPAKIRQLGDIYRATHTAEDDVNVLQSLAVPVDDLAVAAAAVQRDFEIGAIVQLDGWVLSRTEARHCALFSIQSSAIA